MLRPCLCDKEGCRLCWLYHNNNDYRKLWTMPSKIDQAINLVIAIRKRIESDYKNVTDEIYTRRLATCAGCPNKTDDWRCMKCGCYLNIKAKWESEKCPENRWELLVIKETKGCGCANK